MKPDHLLQMAIGLADANTGRPRRADLCRAVSTAYYAMFHCLSRTCADSLAGRSRSVGNRAMWRRVYRALEHRQARTRCENLPPAFPDSVREFAKAFAALQSSRHYSDYDPDYPVRKSNATAAINDARTAIGGLLATPASVRRDFAIHVLTKVRPDA